jgi:hypothetical protein
MTASVRRQMLSPRGPRPCDACGFLQRCAGAQIACKDFGYFVHTGQVRREHRRPSREQYIKTMGAEA